MTTRRGFIQGAAALIATPPIVRASSLDAVPRALPVEKFGWTAVEKSIYVSPDEIAPEFILTSDRIRREMIVTTFYRLEKKLFTGPQWCDISDCQNRD